MHSIRHILEAIQTYIYIFYISNSILFNIYIAALKNISIVKNDILIKIQEQEKTDSKTYVTHRLNVNQYISLKWCPSKENLSAVSENICSHLLLPPKYKMI